MKKIIILLLLLPLTSFALNFGGVNSYVNMAAGTPVALPVTMTAWVYSPAFPSFGGIISSKDTANGGYRIATNNATFSFTLGAVADYPCGTVLTVGAWNFVAATVTGNNGTLICYLNGVQKSTVAIGDALASSNYAIGVANGTYWYGNIDDARVYNRVLSPKEIQQVHYGIPTTQKGLIGHWQLLGTSGTVAPDISGSTNNGTLTNSPVRGALSPSYKFRH